MTAKNILKLQFSTYAPAAVPVILTVLFIFSFLLWKIGGFGKKFIMYFEHTDLHQVYCEPRLLKNVQEKSQTAVFLDELAAGPVSPRYKMLFPRGTRILSSFERNGTLFINLSEDALAAGGLSSSTLRGTEILADNIFANFRNIDNIKIYIMGSEIYSERGLLQRKKKR